MGKPYAVMRFRGLLRGKPETGTSCISPGVKFAKGQTGRRCRKLVLAPRSGLGLLVAFTQGLQLGLTSAGPRPFGGRGGLGSGSAIGCRRSGERGSPQRQSGDWRSSIRGRTSRRFSTQHAGSARNMVRHDVRHDLWVGERRSRCEDAGMNAATARIACHDGRPDAATLESGGPVGSTALSPPLQARRKRQPKAVAVQCGSLVGVGLGSGLVFPRRRASALLGTTCGPRRRASGLPTGSIAWRGALHA